MNSEENPYLSPQDLERPAPQEAALEKAASEEVALQPPQSMLGLFFLDPTRRLRTIWRFLIFGAGFFAIQLAVGIVVVVGFVVYLFASGSMLQSDPDKGAIGAMEMEHLMHQNMLVINATLALPLTAATLVLVLLLRKFLDRRSFASLGFVWPERRVSSSVSGGFLLGSGIIFLGVTLVWFLGGYQLGSSSPSWITAVLIPALVLMAFVEEIVFRSYLLQNMIDVKRTTLGVIITSLLFSLVHVFNPAAMSSIWPAINLFGAGLVLSLAYLVSGNIWFPTALHFAWNFSQGVLLNLPISGMQVEGLLPLEAVETAPQWLTGGEFGLEASAICALIEFVLIALFLAMLAARKQRASPDVPLNGA